MTRPEPSGTVVLLSRVVGLPVLSSDGTRVGRVVDLTVQLPATTPVVHHVAVGDHGGARHLVPWSVVGRVTDRDLRLAIAGPEVAAHELPGSAHLPDVVADHELLLGRDVLDSQVVDLTGRRLTRVWEVLLAPRDDAAVLVSATVGTTLAPWGLSFIQSYAVDKRLTPADLRYERIDVVVGSVLTGMIGLFVIVTCAATLHVRGTSIESAADAASALEPLAGGQARLLFAVGLVGAAVLTAAILPLSTAYSVCEFTGHEGALDDGMRRAPVFYGTYLVVMGLAAGLVLPPGVSLIPVLVLTQVLNVVLLLPLMIIMCVLGRDPDVMAEHVITASWWPVHVAAILLVALCVGALGLLSVPVP
jgi:sporulation protein YlmC with PRC-barrel domain